MTFNELLIFVLLEYGIVEQGDQIKERVPDVPKITDQVDHSRGQPILYARLSEHDDYLTAVVELKLHAFIIFYEYGTQKKNGRSYDGIMRRMKHVVYSLEGKKLKQSFKTLN